MVSEAYLIVLSRLTAQGLGFSVFLSWIQVPYRAISIESLREPTLTERVAYDLDKFRFSARISTYISPNETGLLQSPRLKNYNTLFLEAPEKLAAIESLHVLI